ncbi:hypothetical protein Trydic_g14256 [Trypoxylus dichotomus]
MVKEGPSDPMSPLPALRTPTAELPRGRGLRQMRMAASDDGARSRGTCRPSAPYARARTPPATEDAPSLPTATVGKPQPRLLDPLSQNRRCVRQPQLQTPKEAPTAMETDAPKPSTSTARPSYAAAVKKSAAKTVARKPKASGKPNTPAATTGPKPTPKKPETPEPGKPTKP